MLLRFAGFELDRQRAELRGPDGDAIKLRPKTLGILILLAERAGRVVSKQELMDAVWPNVHVGDDSLFQCIRELRTALGDDQRQLIKLVSGRGYLFTAEVSIDPASAAAQIPPPAAASPAEASAPAEAAPPWRLLGLRRPAALAAAGLGVVIALAVVATMIGPGVLFGRRPPTIAVMPIAAAGSDREVTAMAANLTTRLADGLAKIENIRVSAPHPALPSNGAPQADFVVSGELQKSERSWEVRARMVRPATGEVVWSAPVSVELEAIDLPVQQSRLAAGVGHLLALRIGTLLNADVRSTMARRGSPPGSSNVAIEQATASIMQTTRERFATAQTMLEKALADDPDNVNLAVSLAALQLRGVQMAWYSPDESAAAQVKARSILQRALRLEPDSIPVLEAYCRFLNTTNEFVDSLVACARTLNFDPWDGLALYHIGLAQLQLGRFEDALATFKQADSFGTPQVSRWTWKLGAGWAYLMMDRSAEALPWLQNSIAITPASGRSYMLLAAAYEGLGQPAEAKTAMEKGLALRPGSNVSNFAVPRKNASAAFVAAAQRIERTLVAVGLPEQ
jgi:DNA-binding winged helix-turn-helix (wHTH) protein/tetratricopeptide (TPR) repeat protein/TolB-like protein